MPGSTMYTRRELSVEWHLGWWQFVHEDGTRYPVPASLNSRLTNAAETVRKRWKDGDRPSGEA